MVCSRKNDKLGSNFQPMGVRQCFYGVMCCYRGGLEGMQREEW